jgi:glucan biosynthesis protein C
MESTTARLHGFDAVRGLALTLGVFLHAALSFMPGAEVFWIVSDVDQSTALALAFYLIHIFRMTTFFLLAGFFGHVMFHRLGLKAFVRDRLKRIALPLVVGWPVVIVSMLAVIVWAVLLANGGTLPEERAPAPAFTPRDFPLTHLWFLYVLLLFYAAAIIVRSLVAGIDRPQRVRIAVDRCVRFFMGWWGPLLLAAPLCVSLYFRHDWVMWFGIPTPDKSLYPGLAPVVAFGGAFTLGWLIHRQADLIYVWERRWLFNLALAVISASASLAIVGFTPVLAPAKQGPVTLAYAAAYSVAVWSGTLAFLGVGLRFLSGHSPARRYLADASYWIYLVHLPVVTALQVAVSRLDLPWMIKFPLMLAAAFGMLFLSYHFLVRDTFIGAVLNGRRKESRTAAREVPISS